VARDECKPEGMQTTCELIRILARLTLPERAAEIAAQYLILLAHESRFDGWDNLVEPLYGKNASLAIVWWRFLREQLPQEEPGVTMKKVRDLLEGKPVANRDELCRKIAVWIDPNRPVVNPAQQESPNVPEELPEIQARKSLALVAAAEAMRVAGQPDAARDYFEQALKARDSVSARIRYGDFLAGKNRFLEAAQQYEKAANKQPDRPLALFLQGWALIKAGKEKEGRRCQDLAHWMPLGSEQVRYDFADELEKRHFVEAARQERDFILKSGWYRYWYVSNLIS